MSNFKLLEFPAHTDARGTLTPIEFDDSLPFTPQRVYYAYNTKAARGGHCHLQEKEIFICLGGSCRALIDSDGQGKQEILLDSPTKALYVSTHVWHEFDDFSDGATLLCLSSTHYLPGEQNYETDYEEFKKLIVTK